MRKYRASNQAPFGGILLLLFLGIITGAATGGILWAIDNFLNFYLVIAFPIIAGAIAGGLLVLGVRAGKVRSPILAVLIGLLTGVLMYGVYHGAMYYITFRGAARDAYVKNVGTVPTDQELDQTLNQVLFSEVKDTGFVGFMKLLAEQGITITNTNYGSSSSGNIDLSGAGAWAYWLVEIFVAGVIAAAMAAREAGQPFDEEGDVWYSKPTLFASASNKSRKALLNALKDGDFQTVGGLLSSDVPKYPRMDVLIRRSPAAATGLAPQDVYLMVNYSQRKGRTSAVRSGVISPAELDSIRLGMQQAAMRAPAAPAR